MKIGLIGINRYAGFLNFACNLHAYAFQQHLMKLGYDATFIDYKPIYHEGINLRDPASFIEAKYRSTISMKARTPEEAKQRNAVAKKIAEIAMGYRALTEDRKVRYDKFEEFISQHLNFTDTVFDSDLLEVEDPGMDCYICVTDVIWQPWLPDYSFDRGFILGSKAFDGKPKIAYAPSRGAQPDFDSDTAEIFFDYLDDIDAISARERDFSQYIEHHTGRTIPTVVDPVLLHEKSFWEKIAVPPRERKYLLLYYVMERSADTISKAVEYAKAHDLTIVELSDRPLPYGKVNDPDIRHIPRYDVSAEEWLGYIANATAVFTNSFHGCCFSLIFETLFFVGKRNGNKVPNFLAEFGLTSQRFAPEDEVENFNASIDFNEAKAKVQERRAQSEEFLLTALQHAEESSSRSTEHDATTVSKKDTRRREIKYVAHFHSGTLVGDEEQIQVEADERHPQELAVKKLKSGALEYSTPKSRYTNSGTEKITPNLFRTPSHQLAGWTLRFRIDKRWFWYLHDGKIAAGDTKGTDLDAQKMVFADEASVPHLFVNSISSVVFVARWRKVEPRQTKESVKTRLARLKNRIADK